MGIGTIVVIVVVLVIVIAVASNASRSFDDPKPMTNERLLSAIAGQADWLEKMKTAPVQSQQSPSIIALTRDRKGYIARLCLEVVSRASSSEGQLKYPGASVALNVFSETAEHAKSLEASGVSKENAAVRAVKQKMFAENGVRYPSSWEQ